MNTIVSTMSKTLLGGLIRGKLIKEIIGWENIPKKTNFILASNHLSHLDWFICGYIVAPRKFTFIGQVDRYNSGMAGFGRRLMYWYASVIPIDRKSDESKRQALIKGVEVLKRGYCVIIYPEGGRSYDGKIREFKPGVGKLHLESGVPILPVAFKGSYEILPPGGKLNIKKNVRVAIGKPLDFPKLRNKAKEKDCSSDDCRQMCGEIAKAAEREVKNLLEKIPSR